MNMVRIRNIIEMRRACKAPSLLPPKKKKNSSDTDSKRGVQEVVDINVKIRQLRTDVGQYRHVTCVVYGSEDGRHGPWNMVEIDSTIKAKYQTDSGTSSQCTASDVLEKSPEIDLPELFSTEFQFERPQAYKIEICDWTGDDAIPIGYTTFLISEVVNSMGGTLMQRIINERTGECISLIDISSKLRPHVQPLMLQVEVKDVSKKVLPDNASVYFQMYRVEDDLERSLIYKSEAIRPHEKMRFRQFTLSGSDINDNPERLLEVICYYRDEKNKRGIVGTFQTTQLALRNANAKFHFTNENYKAGRKSCGTFEILKSSDLTIFSFLEYLSFGLNLHLSFAVDFSQPSQGTPKHTFLDDVEMSIRSIGECFKDYNCSNKFAAFGFGARIPPHYRESHEFCLNLDVDPSCSGIEGVVDTFRNTYARVQPLNKAHFAHVIYYVSKIAQNALLRGDPNRPQYHVLVIITRGCIDDVKEAVQAVIFASRAPISIVFVGIEDGNLSEIERLGNAGRKLAYQGRKADRDMLQYVNVDECREQEQNPSFCLNLCERALSQIPWQLATFMMRNGVIPRTANDMRAIQNDSHGLRQQLSSLQRDSIVTLDYGDEDDMIRYDDSSPSSRPSSASLTSSQMAFREPIQRKIQPLSSDMRSMSMHCGGGRASPRPGLIRERDSTKF